MTTKPTKLLTTTSHPPCAAKQSEPTNDHVISPPLKLPWLATCASNNNKDEEDDGRNNNDNDANKIIDSRNSPPPMQQKWLAPNKASHPKKCVN